MKRLVLALAALAAIGAAAPPAAAHVWVETCYQTIDWPCAVCVAEGSVATCVEI